MVLKMDVRTIQSITIQQFVLFLYNNGVAINLEVLDKKREEFLALGDKLAKETPNGATQKQQGSP
jgi:hypothetical protein